MNFENFTLPILVAILATLVAALVIHFCTRFGAKVWKESFKGLYNKFKNHYFERKVFREDVELQIRKLPFPFATTRAKGRLICIHCFILDKRDVLIAPDHKFIKCTNCSNQAKTPPWFRNYVNTF